MMFNDEIVEEETFEELRNQAKQGHSEAQYILGYCHAVGNGVDQNYKKAVKWYRLAAKQGCVKAQFALGVYYHEGKGVLKNYKKAVKWYYLAADQGHTTAPFCLGLCYFLGEGVSQDYVKAYLWFLLVAYSVGKNDELYVIIVEQLDRTRKKLGSSEITKAEQEAQRRIDAIKKR